MKRILIALSCLLLLVGVVPPAQATTPNPDHKVTICHRTASYINPYVRITVDVASVDGNATNNKGGDHAAEHQGPVFYLTIPKHTEWGDIIPPGTYGGVTIPGLNWSQDGQDIWNNGCKLPPPPPPPVNHNPTLVGNAVCDLTAEKYTVTYTGNTDGAVNTVPNLPVVHVVVGTSTSDSASVTFKYSDGPDVTKNASVTMAGDCKKTPPPPVDHHPTLVGNAVCNLATEQYTVTYTGNTDGATSTVPGMPVVHIVVGTSTSDSASVTFKYSDGPDVTKSDTVFMAGDCKKTPPPPVVHNPTLQVASVVCDTTTEQYTVRYDGTTDGATSTNPALPVVHVIPGTSTSDSATVVFYYSDGPNVTRSASTGANVNGTCIKPPPGPKTVNWVITTKMPPLTKTGTLVVSADAVVTATLTRYCGYMNAKFFVDGALVKTVRVPTNYRTLVKIFLDGVMVASEIGKAYGC